MINIKDKFFLSSYGIEFPWKKIQVLWIWPWRRRRLMYRYLNMSQDGVFMCLEDLYEVHKEREEYIKSETTRLLNQSRVDSYVISDKDRNFENKNITVFESIS